MPIYPLHPLRRGDPRSGTRYPIRRGRRPRRPVLPFFLCPRRAGCPPPAARPCTALPAGHTGPALQKYCVPSRADRAVRPYKPFRRGRWSCCGVQNFCAALRRTLEILTAATRSPRFLCHWQHSVRSPHRPAAHCTSRKNHVIARALRARGNPHPPSPRKKRGRLSASSFLHN